MPKPDNVPPEMKPKEKDIHNEAFEMTYTPVYEDNDDLNPDETITEPPAPLSVKKEYPHLVKARAKALEKRQAKALLKAEEKALKKAEKEEKKKATLERRRNRARERYWEKKLDKEVVNEIEKEETKPIQKIEKQQKSVGFQHMSYDTFSGYMKRYNTENIPKPKPVPKTKPIPIPSVMPQPNNSYHPLNYPSLYGYKNGKKLFKLKSHYILI